MPTKQNDILDLFTDYLTGCITPDDAQQLQQWLEASPENEQRLRNYRELWIAAHNEHYDSKAALRRFRRNAKKLDERSKAQRHARARQQLHNALRWAAVICLPLLLTGLVITYLQVNNILDRTITYATTTGQQSSFILPDGTLVQMDENSLLEYSHGNFIHNHRKVTFQGVARFDVTADSLHPFDILTKTEQVRVLGTSFTFSSHPNDRFTILSLDKGRVEYTNLQTGETQHMEAGDVLTYNKTTDRLYCRTRSPQEMLTMLPEQDANLRRIYGMNGDTTRHVVVNRPVAPGIYEIRLDRNSGDIDLQKTGNSRKLFHSGNGTKQSPYVITTPFEMCNMRVVLIPHQMVYFSLACDIDLKGINWIPLNDAEDEYNNWICLEGNNHVIRNLTPIVSKGYSSFFGVLCGECRNVGFADAHIVGTEKGSGVLGGYVGHNSYPHTTIVENCFFTGQVNSRNYAGGIAGTVDGNTILHNCYSSVDVSSITSMAGGLIARIRGNLTMEYCYTDGNVTGQQAGGIFGGRIAQGGKDVVNMSNVAVANKSVCGNKKAYIVGETTSADSLQNVEYTNYMRLNGEPVPNGITPAQMKKLGVGWPNTWFHDKPQSLGRLHNQTNS